MAKLLIAYGQSLIKNFEIIVEKAINDGFRILALDIETANYINKMGHAVTFIEDWITAEERVEIWRHGVWMEKEWFKHVYGEIPNSSEFDVNTDHYAMAGFWYEIALQMYLERAFVVSGIGLIRLIRFKGYGAAVGHSESDTFGAYWQCQPNPRKLDIEVIEIKKELTIREMIFSKTIKDIIKFILVNIVQRMTFTFRNNKNRAFFSFSKGELNYYLQNIVKFIDKYAAQFDVTIMVNNINEMEASRFKEKRDGIEIIGGAFGNAIFHKKNRKLVTTILVELTDDAFSRAYLGSKEHFEYYETVRWAELQKLKKRYRQEITKRKASVVVVSNIEDKSHRLLGEVATDCKIPSISLPHGVLALTHRGLSSTDYYAVGNEWAKILAIGSGIPSEKIVKLKNLDPIHEYPMNVVVQGSNRFNILVLLDPVQQANRSRVYAHPFVGYKEQILALEEISVLRRDERYKLFIKTHPGWPEHEVIEFADKDLMSSVCPKDASLEHLLGIVDLVIALNYASAALVAVAKAELPTILFWRAPLLAAIPCGYAPIDRFQEMGYLTNSGDELIGLVEKLRVDRAYRQELKSLSQQFNEKYLLTEKYESVENFIFEMSRVSKIKQEKNDKA